MAVVAAMIFAVAFLFLMMLLQLTQWLFHDVI